MRNTIIVLAVAFPALAWAQTAMTPEELKGMKRDIETVEAADRATKRAADPKLEVIGICPVEPLHQEWRPARPRLYCTNGIIIRKTDPEWAAALQLLTAGAARASGQADQKIETETGGGLSVDKTPQPEPQPEEK